MRKINPSKRKLFCHGCMIMSNKSLRSMYTMFIWRSYWFHRGFYFVGVYLKAYVHSPRIDATGRPGQVSRRRAPWRRSKLEGKCRAPKIGPRGQTPVRARRAEARSAAETVWRRWQADSRYYTLILAKRPKSQLFARSSRSLSPPV